MLKINEPLCQSQICVLQTQSDGHFKLKASIDIDSTTKDNMENMFHFGSKITEATGIAGYCATIGKPVYISDLINEDDEISKY